MNEEPQGLPEAPPPLPPPRRASRRLIVWVAFSWILAGALGVTALVLFLHNRGSFLQGNGPPAETGVPEAAADARNFSSSNSVSIILGEAESSQGLEFIAGERDGLTGIGKHKGKRCRSLALPPRAGGGNSLLGYFYFAIDPTFKEQQTKSVRIEVEYYNEKKGIFSLQYDASAASNAARSIYTRAGPALALDGAKEWETATFHIRDGAFANSQKGGADFRLEVSPAELYVRRVTVTREKEEPSASAFE